MRSAPGGRGGPAERHSRRLCGRAESDDSLRMIRLDAPFTLGARTLANRFAVAPLTTTQSHADGSPSEADTAWLTRLADDGYGMVITCASAVSKTSIAFPQQLSFGDDALVPALTALAARVRRPGTCLIAQLCHGGSRAPAALTGQPAHSASAYELPLPGFVAPRALSVAQIEAIVDDFAAAAVRAMRAGFDGVELHGANGYLFTQFTSTMTNRRSDAWGGSLENRARLSRETVRAIRARVPRDFVVGYRMSFEGMGLETGLDLDENIAVMRWLADDGIDYGHVSHLSLAAPSVKRPDRPALALIREGVGRALPLIAAGSVMTPADAQRAFELGADLVALGRAAIGNTHAPAKLARGESLVPTPYRRAHLAALGISPDFVRYLTTAVPVSSLGIVAD